MGGFVTRLLIVLGVSGAAGATAAWVRQLPWKESKAEYEQGKAIRSELRETRGIGLPRLRELMQQGAILIDAREREQFVEGHLDAGQAAVPTLNVPPEEFDQHLDRLMPLMGFQIVLYCNSATCDLAEELFQRMIESGFTREDISIYTDGWEGIQKAGLPQNKGADTWTGFEPVDPGMIDDETGAED